MGDGMKKYLVAILALFASLTAAAQVPSFHYLTGASEPPIFTCSVSVNNGMVAVSSTPKYYQCSNVTGSYAWNAIGGGGTVGSGTAGQIAVYPSNGITVQGATAIPNGITAFTQALGDSSSLVANTAWVKSLSAVNAVQASIYGAVFDTRFFNDGSTTNTANTLTSATLACTTADVGKLALVVNATTHVYPFGTGLVTVTGCTSSTIATLSATASQTTTGTLNWAIGTDDTTSLTNAVAAAWGNNRAVALPCGATIISGRPFVWTTQNILSQTYGIAGCSGTNQTMFFLHPQVTSAIQTGGTVFYSPPTSAAAIGWNPAGFFYNRAIADFMITSFDGYLPFASGSVHILDPQDNVYNVAAFSIYQTGASFCDTIDAQTGETKISRFNVQHTNCAGVYMGGQGLNTISDSIFAYMIGGPAVNCTVSSQCSLINDYFTVLSSATFGCPHGACNIAVSLNSNLNIIGGVYSINSATQIIDTTAGGTLSTVNITDAVFSGNSSPRSMWLADNKVFGNVARTTLDAKVDGPGNLRDLGGNTMGAVTTAVNFSADGHSLNGACTGVATASQTLGLFGTGANVTAATCTSTTIGTGVVSPGARTLQNLIVHATTGGVGASSGVFTVLVNGSPSTLTCTIGTATSCEDVTHTVSTANGDLISLQFTTQATETLAGVQTIVEWN